ncbi:MAG: GxxExxY protein [Anaerolineae bacterium]
MDINALTEQIIGAAIEVHRELGPGLLESAYEACLAHELTLRGLPYERQKAIPVRYKGVEVDCGFRLDLWVDQRVIVELKAVDALNAIHKAQMLSYLRLTQCRIGLLMNFNVLQLTNGLRRIILD